MQVQPVKQKIIYDEVIRLLKSGQSILGIQEKTKLARNTIYSIKKDEKPNKEAKSRNDGNGVIGWNL
ncbi:helix-turn-helix domain-containing protein [Peribacillus castrilensis]|uniref:helix-turn-helix domain-containing protein n=1 Tax=Bacillaceae TaxID=186817 RepID=UPI00065FAAEC|nr:MULTISPECIES: helix-turn-helix domain-containing protein [Bacillaceae]MCT1390098.1 helix-turn-helix domain-containing protein [Peribacillus frigoritolerans]NCT40017.1 helix-turn-helix domain-containing protein [Peribacillus frigoritolerans]PRA73817.1 hypothetical protein CQ056_27940 [Peribacillus simplex]